MSVKRARARRHCTQRHYIEFYDPDGSRYGLPTYPYRWAPKGLLTRRQLRANGLRPGGPAHRRSDHLETQRQAPRRLPVPRRSRQAQAASHTSATHSHQRHCAPAAPAPHAATKKTTTSLSHSANVTTARPGGAMKTTVQTASSVNSALTANRRRTSWRTISSQPSSAASCAAYSRRVASGDIEAITEIAAIAAEMATAIRDAITGLRALRLPLGRHRRTDGISRQGPAALGSPPATVTETAAAPSSCAPAPGRPINSLHD